MMAKVAAFHWYTIRCFSISSRKVSDNTFKIVKIAMAHVVCSPRDSGRVHKSVLACDVFQQLYTIRIASDRVVRRADSSLQWLLIWSFVGCIAWTFQKDFTRPDFLPQSPCVELRILQFEVRF